ncbi:hypothetical protein Hanom_Chr15g01338451 [Helianthus anomalus]
MVMPTTLSSINNVAGSNITTATGAMYNNRFMEFSFSLLLLLSNTVKVNHNLQT